MCLVYFSFGMIVLEMVAGQKNNTFHIQDNGDGLVNYVSTSTFPPF